MPYAGKKIDEYGNVKYEGFCIDILDYIAESMKFKYEIQEEPTYGNCDEKECTGMYQKLIDRVRHSDIYAHAKIFEMIFRKKWICSASIFKWTGFLNSLWGFLLFYPFQSIL